METQNDISTQEKIRLFNEIIYSSYKFDHARDNITIWRGDPVSKDGMPNSIPGTINKRYDYNDRTFNDIDFVSGTIMNEYSLKITNNSANSFEATFIEPNTCQDNKYKDQCTPNGILFTVPQIYPAKLQTLTFKFKYPSEQGIKLGNFSIKKFDIENKRHGITVGECKSSTSSDKSPSINIVCNNLDGTDRDSYLAVFDIENWDKCR